MSILRYTSENYGSLIRIAYAATWQISAFTPLSKSQIADAGIIFLADYSWQDIYCSQDTMGHSQNQQRDNGGDRYQQSVVGFIPGDEQQIEDGLQELHDQRYLVRITLPSGTVKIVGSLKEPLDFDQNSNTQITVPGTPGTAIQFSGQTMNRALLVSPL